MSMHATIQLLMVSNSLAQGGAERFALRLANGLDPGRFAVHLVLLRDLGGDPPPRRATVTSLGYRGAADLPRSVGRLRRIIRSLKPDLVLGASSSVNVVTGSALATLQQRPLWIARVDTYRRALWFRQQLLSALYPMAHRVVVNADGMQQALARGCPRLAPKIVHLPNPVDFTEIACLSRKGAAWPGSAGVPRLITVGHAVRAKRWDVLLHAFGRVVRRRPAELVLCGDGALLPRYRRLARQLGLQGRVHFMGHIANPFALLAAADLFILSSEAEGLPNALIEAQGLGRCAVAARCSFGPQEIVTDGVTGRLVPVNDADALADAMMQLIDDEAGRLQMGRAAAEQARRRFDAGAVCARWDALLAASASGIENR